MDDQQLQEIHDDAAARVALGQYSNADAAAGALVAEVRRLTAEHTAALQAAREEGAAAMREAAVRLLDACGGPRSKLTIEDAIHAVNHAALPLDAPGGGS